MDDARRQLIASHPANLRYEIRRVRFRVLGVALVIVATTLVAAGITASWYLRDVHKQERLNELVDSRSRIVATVEAIRDTPEGEYGERTATVEVDGKPVDIINPAAFSWTDMFAGFPYEPGDRVTVVVDPRSPDRAWDVADRRDLSPWAHITFVLFIWGILAGIWKIFLWDSDWTLPFKFRAIPHFLWRPKIATARVVELRPGKWWDDFTVATSCATLVVDLEGRFHVWDIHTYGPVDIDEGLEFTVWGKPGPGGWVVGLTKPHTIYPRSKLD